MKIPRTQFLYFVYWLQSHFPKRLDLYLQFLEKSQTLETLQDCVEIMKEGFDREFDFQNLAANEERIFSLIEKGKINFACYGEETYPESFKSLEYAPFVFSYLGNPVWMNHQLISVVGSREPCADSLQWVERELIAYLAHCKIGVVSGGARGIDQAAHKAALLAGQPTVVFVPAGLGRLYPRELSRLVPVVLSTGGAVVSEYSYHQEMHIRFFEARNRLIATMGEFLLIIEGKRRSGTLLTAQLAMNQGKPIACLPGHPLHPQFSGTLDLLVSGAHLIRDRLDLMSFHSNASTNH
ncbi:MAG: DNA-processing protein DprA [Pseudobdellovibrionaceae bacterium]